MHSVGFMIKKAAFLIHGFLSDKNDFAPLLPLLKDRYDHVFCPDLPAHGVDRPKHSRVKFKEIMEFVESNFDRLKEIYDTVDVFGFSMGGPLAAYLASTREIGRLVLLAPAHKNPAPLFLFAGLKFRGECRKERRAQKKGKLRQFYGVRICKEGDLKKDRRFAAGWFFKVLLPRLGPRNVYNFKKIIRFCNRSLKEINIPVLIIWGRLDQLVPHSAIKKISRRCVHPAFKKIVYRDISHGMLYSCAHARITDDIINFLNETDSI